MTDNEKFYDEEIAPALAEIAKKCMDRGMSITAVVEYNPGEPGITAWLGKDAGLAMIMLRHCAKMGTNLDGYVMGLMGYAKDKGVKMGSSIVARLMGWEGE